MIRLSNIVIATCFCTILCVSCRPSANTSGKPTIQNKGSDTLLEVAQAWAETYTAAEVEVSGGGSGVGIAALEAGTIDIANCSREMKPEELERVKEHTGGKDPVRIVAGYDALAIYVHKDNPIEEISMEQLEAIFSADGSTKSWSDLGIEIPGCDGKIELSGRQSSSGTYEYFRVAVMGKKGKYSLDVIEQNGSRALVQFVANTPCAIGYSGMGYKTDAVKFVKMKKAAGAGILPSASAVHDGSYPIARPLFLYTKGGAAEHITEYLAWVRSDAGQKILEEVGYIPLSPEDRLD